MRTPVGLIRLSQHLAEELHSGSRAAMGPSRGDDGHSGGISRGTAVPLVCARVTPRIATSGH